MSKQRIARICWNTEGWSRPSGSAKQTEGEGTYARAHGFGHEEWLFRMDWQLESWHYAFLEPVRRAKGSLEGEVHDILLYTIDRDFRRFYVGRFHACEILTSAKAADAASEYKARGWLNQMVREVGRIGGDVDILKTEDPGVLLNIRFRPTALELYEPFRQASPQDKICRRGFSRYQLLTADVEFKRQFSRPFEGTRELRPTSSSARKGSGPVQVDYYHNEGNSD